MPTTQEQALTIHRRLVEAYGERPRRERLEPVAELVSTILSQNTNDNNRDRAFARLRERFSTWEEVRDAPLNEIEEAIRPAGLQQTKAQWIRQALRRIEDQQDQISLDFLAELPLEEARSWLTDLKGVGPKTAAIVLLFAFDRPAFPVDTHVHRVSQRLGLVPSGASREKAHDLLEELLPEEIYYTFHLNLIRHGRQICHARGPVCSECPLLDLCPYGEEQVEG